MCSTRDRQRAIVLAAVKDKPFGWPRKARPSLTATRHDGAVELRSGRKNGSAGVKQKNGCESRFRAKILSSRYARAAINFPGTKNRNTRGFSHQTPWSCLKGLDPHSEYLDAQGFRTLQEEALGQFGGLGVQVALEQGLLKIVRAIPQSSAAKSGLRPGDIILRLNDQPII